MRNNLVVPSINPNVTVTLNIGLGSSLAWGGYKAQDAKHGEVMSLVDILDVPHRAARIIEQLRGFCAVVHKPDYYHRPVACGYIQHDPDYSELIKYKIVQSNTEATLVVQFEAVARDIIGQCFALADHLKQDCIAVWIHNDVNGGIGQLIGRYNYVWSGGYFNSEYFIHLENADVRIS